MDKPLLSIITINKNNAAGVRRTITSLLPLQSLSEVECLFIDGRSNDESLQIASEFYLTSHLRSESDEGIYQAMNKGLALASGQWVVWLNSGDEWISATWPDLKGLLQVCNSNILCAASEIIDHKNGACLMISHFRSSILPWGMVNHSSTIFRRNTVLKYNGYNESYKIAADRELLVRLYLNHESISSSDLCLTRFWLGGLSDQKLLLRAQENLRLDLEAGLINRGSYRYGLFRSGIYHRLVRPSVLLLRRTLALVGIKLPPLGAHAGPLGELPRDAFAGKLRH